jgi:hypothetical protein
MLDPTGPSVMAPPRGCGLSVPWDRWRRRWCWSPAIPLRSELLASLTAAATVAPDDPINLFTYRG